MMTFGNEKPTKEVARAIFGVPFALKKDGRL
jgi:hypothetical protein